jgi:hypothetical protein
MIKCPLTMDETALNKTKIKLKRKTTTLAAIIIIATIIALPLDANKTAFAINSEKTTTTDLNSLVPVSDQRC